MHVACGDITNVEINGDKLIVRSSDDFLLNILEDGRREIENAIRWQGLNLSLELVKFESKAQLQEKDIVKLTRLFSDKLKIED